MENEHAPVSVTCRGVAVTGDLRIASRSEAEAFIELSEPLPVGTTVVVTVGDEPAFEARVLKVREDIAGRDDAAGMQVAIGAPPLAIARAAVKAEAEAEAAQAPAQAPGEAAPESETAHASSEAAPEAAPASGESAPAAEAAPVARATTQDDARGKRKRRRRRKTTRSG